MGEGAAIRESDQLGEGVWPLGAAEERGVTALGTDEGCRLDCGGRSLSREEAEG